MRVRSVVGAVVCASVVGLGVIGVSARALGAREREVGKEGGVGSAQAPALGGVPLGPAILANGDAGGDGVPETGDGVAVPVGKTALACGGGRVAEVARTRSGRARSRRRVEGECAREREALEYSGRFRLAWRMSSVSARAHASRASGVGVHLGRVWEL